jgi:hypothetical protein
MPQRAMIRRRPETLRLDGARDAALEGAARQVFAEASLQSNALVIR